MEREEVDIQLSELESRLDRLRVLYEHYFMGLERIEPSVPRKDVERRVAELRRIRFHSTVQRFKFQTIVQRYNTMQQHWNRVCREIELGTYRRHKLKAERAFAIAAPDPAPVAQAPTEAQAPQAERQRRTEQVRKAAEDDLRELLDSDLDMGSALHGALRGLQDIPDSLPPGPQRPESLLAKLKVPEAKPVATLSPALAASLPPKLSLGFPSPAVGPGGNARTPGTSAPGTPEAPRSGTRSPARPETPEDNARDGVTRTGVTRTAAAGSTGTTRTSTGFQVRTGGTTTAGTTGPRSAAETRAGATGSQDPAASKNPAVPRNAGDPAAPRAPVASKSPGASRDPAPGRVPPAPKDPASRDQERLSEDRVRALHQAYVEARAKTNATTVSFEKMERSLRETEAKLRQTHQGKKIDFDVLVKDGKAILKPKLG